MNLTRPIVFLDLETTGTDPVFDRIVELGVSVLMPDLTMPVRGLVKRFNPGMPIPAAATECHHITDADVADCPPFSSFAPGLARALKGRDIAGYNLGFFDLPLLDEEMRRCGLRLEMDGVRVIDAAGIYFRKEGRKLEDAIRKYCKREPRGSHGAGIDADETMEVFLGQLIEYPDLDAMTVDELATFSRRSGEQQPVDLAGKLYRDAEGFICYGFGKNKDKRVEEDPGYAKWMLGASFPGSTNDVLREELYRLDQLDKMKRKAMVEKYG